MERNEENNIFKYATKELSQDAFICWLVNWYNYKDSELYPVAKKFLNKIIEKSNKKIKKCIIIEDKTFTKEHNDQIKDYRDKLKKEYKKLSDNDFITVYYKMIDYDEESTADINIDIKDMLNILDGQKIKNSIYIDYKKYLEKIKNILEKFKDIPFDEWPDNREIYYKFIYEYKEKCKNEEKLLPIKDYNVQIQNGGIYIDFNDIKIKNSKLCKNIYYCLNFMSKGKSRIEIRARDIKKDNKEKINKLSEKIKENLDEIPKEIYKIKEVKNSESNGKKDEIPKENYKIKEVKNSESNNKENEYYKTKLLAKVFFNEGTNISNFNLYGLLEKINEILEENI